MASITPRKNKNGEVISYCIRVFRGYDDNGNKLKPYTMTYKPDRNMTEKQIEKELNRQAVIFEEQCTIGYSLDGKQTFSQYAAYVLETKESAKTKRSTISRYKQLLERINAGIGHIRLTDIRPQHLNQLYKELRKPNLRKSSSYATAKACFEEECKKSGKLKKDIVSEAGIAYISFNTMQRRERVSLPTAEAVAKVLGKPVDRLFDVERDNRALSEKTIAEHHRLIHMVMKQAEKEMIIPYNPADKVIDAPSRGASIERKGYELDVLEAIRDKLQKEPLKWRVITNMLIVTGCRRGEIMGLKWSAVDFEKRALHIRNNLLYEAEIGVYQDTPKTVTSNRIVILPDETFELLEKYHNWWQKLRKDCGASWHEYIQIPDGKGEIHEEKADFLFLQEKNMEKLGYPMNPDSITDYLDKFSKREGLPHINPHAFRHTLATQLGFNGVDIVTISKWLGHNNATTTLNIYQHLHERSKEEVVNCVSNVILKKKA